MVPKIGFSSKIYRTNAHTRAYEYKGTLLYKGMPLQVKKTAGGHIKDICISRRYAPGAQDLF